MCVHVQTHLHHFLIRFVLFSVIITFNEIVALSVVWYIVIIMCHPYYE